MGSHLVWIFIDGCKDMLNGKCSGGQLILANLNMACSLKLLKHFHLFLNFKFLVCSNHWLNIEFKYLHRDKYYMAY